MTRLSQRGFDAIIRFVDWTHPDLHEFGPFFRGCVYGLWIGHALAFGGLSLAVFVALAIRIVSWLAG